VPPSEVMAARTWRPCARASTPHRVTRERWPASEYVRGVSEEQLQPGDTLDDRGVEDVLDEGYSPPDHEPGHLRHPHEVDEPETLDERLAEEEPDVGADLDGESDDYLDDGEVGDARSGRLVAQDGGSDDDEDSELWATDAGIDGAGASAEEAAMHIVDDECAASEQARVLVATDAAADGWR